MATITLTIPDSIVNRVLDAVAASKGYGPGGGQTKAQFAKSVIATYLKSIVVDYEAKRDADAAFRATSLSADADISIT